MTRQPSSLSREEIALLARVAGLDLAPQHLDELVKSWHWLEPVLGRIPRQRVRTDEPAHVFDPRKFMPTKGDT
jgi:hypothetical protein